ncbi:hypothetical protein EMIHUDRAFT_352913 [Emiliania huxleyi CCMP1516]|uniref:Uncharacterized protein n=2 Tax=Emiliania huxleyi TaxID=2903 RepID=A0A0D3K5Y8_EMIH1|nr:hypothetical protein EMIHUDRAFT_372483 [Emiliania huxleyi CCMP1516]XP_005783602.1 hypothetical protein EMIHUDRAFT_352913 [Emiliania huxleyi CCMP1516]EOD05057.1 hypothetical protein EMIHUDRAFT_372483 [Emiliania huxleyi CCMP1516]EOD31173.1 hypothetical protein EMIHUDRAFT_352913 [Emiliania huxleyi CCMP1516]|eukprot:XP_005757486.1 hypothetical protein EMIHUDRAFT_372483 [Emiliania huxleyi CCMP1516]
MGAPQDYLGRTTGRTGAGTATATATAAGTGAGTGGSVLILKGLEEQRRGQSL